MFETVRCAAQNTVNSAGSAGSLNLNIGDCVSNTTLMSYPRMSIKTECYNTRRLSGSIYSSSSLGYPSLDSASHSDYESSQTDSDDGYP